MMDKGYIHFNKIITYDIVMSPAFGNATISHAINLQPSRKSLRRMKINKIFGLI